MFFVLTKPLANHKLQNISLLLKVMKQYFVKTARLRIANNRWNKFSTQNWFIGKLISYYSNSCFSNESAHLKFQWFENISMTFVLIDINCYIYINHIAICLECNYGMHNKKLGLPIQNHTSFISSSTCSMHKILQNRVFFSSFINILLE